MKKTLIAIAALSAIAGVAHAQSSVTLYGLVDGYVGQTTTETTGVGASAKVKQSVVNSNGQNNSRWGLRGTEDLGGGLKAIFGLEGGFNVDNGSFNNNAPGSTASIFGRTAFVGVNGGFGTVTLGRLYPAYDDLRGATNMINDTNFATTSTVWNTGLKDYQNRSSNAVKYVSPNFAGFSGAISYGAGENKTPTTSAENIASFHVKYVNGPLFVGYGYQREKQNLGATVFGAANPAGLANATRRYNLLGASYDLGVAKLTGQYNMAKGDIAAGSKAEDREYQVGVIVPFGAFAVAGGYSKSKSERAGFNDNSGTGASILATYTLSKRTNLYTGYLATKVESNSAATEQKNSTFGLGVKHTF